MRDNDGLDYYKTGRLPNDDRIEGHDPNLRRPIPVAVEYDNKFLEMAKQLHIKFGITNEQLAFSAGEKKFRIACMQEELDEYVEATTRADELDALVDLAVFLLGTAERQGMLDVFEEAWKRVHKANMAKELGPNEKRENFSVDLFKPEGWEAPELGDLVGETGSEQETLL